MAAPNLTDWREQILRGIGAPVTPENLRFVDAWARAEGGSASNNPFNTTQPATGASSYNSVGVRNYVSPEQGIQATVDTLRNGRYAPIVQALQAGSSADTAASALAASPWGTGSLVQKILGSDQGQAPAAAPSSSPWAGLAEAFYDPLGSYDQGKFGGPIGGHSTHVHVSETNPSQMLRAIQLAQTMGLTAGENPYTGNPADPGVHVEGSYHYRNFPGQYGGKTLGEGLDVSGDPSAMARYYNTVTGRIAGDTTVAPAISTAPPALAPAPAKPRALPASVKQALAILRS